MTGTGGGHARRGIAATGDRVVSVAARSRLALLWRRQAVDLRLHAGKLLVDLIHPVAAHHDVELDLAVDAVRPQVRVDGRELAEQPEGPVVRIIASGDSVTVGQLIRTMRVVTKRRIPIALGSHPSSASQALDLRLTPSGSGDLDALPATPLPAGVKAVYLDILRRLQQVRPTGPAPHAPR